MGTGHIAVLPSDEAPPPCKSPAIRDSFGHKGAVGPYVYQNVSANMPHPTMNVDFMPHPHPTVEHFWS